MDRFIEDYWPALVPALLGIPAVYLLLPQARGSKPVLGALLGALALVLAGLLLIHNETALPETILFYAFSGIAVLGGGLMLSQRNPVHAALSFALVVLSTCGLFLLLAAPFLAAATIIVYAGAIIVTFLFVIMLAQQEGLASADQRSREPFLASIGGFVLMAALLCVVHKTYDVGPADEMLAKIEQVAKAKTPEEIKPVLGEPGKIAVGDMIPDFIKQVHQVFRRFPLERLDLAVLAWHNKDIGTVKRVFSDLYQHGVLARDQQGTLPAPADMKLSAFSGTPPTAELPQGKTTRTMPARNVAGLGRSLFTDYLLPVELAGTLLLVASIGAIVIAGRRTEGLR